MASLAVQSGSWLGFAATGAAGSKPNSACTPASAAFGSISDSVTPIWTMSPGSPVAEPTTTFAAGGGTDVTAPLVPVVGSSTPPAAELAASAIVSGYEASAASAAMRTAQV